MYCIRYPPPVLFFRKKRKPLVCPNCYLLGKEIFVLTAYFAYLAGWLLLTYLLLTLLLTYLLLTVGYEDDDVITTVTIRFLYVYVPVCTVCIHKQKSTQYDNTYPYPYLTLPIHRISLLHVGNFPDPIRYENVLSFGCSVGIGVFAASGARPI